MESQAGEIMIHYMKRVFRQETSLPYMQAIFQLLKSIHLFMQFNLTSNVEKWVNDTPESFRFVVKAYQGMTGHMREGNPFDSKEEMFHAFLESVKPYVTSNKLGYDFISNATLV